MLHKPASRKIGAKIARVPLAFIFMGASGADQSIQILSFLDIKTCAALGKSASEAAS